MDYLVVKVYLFQSCDGEGLTFPFGRRSIQSRDINVKCCDTDLCNYPSTSTVSPFQKSISFFSFSRHMTYGSSISPF